MSSSSTKYLLLAGQILAAQLFAQPSEYEQYINSTKLDDMIPLHRAARTGDLDGLRNAYQTTAHINIADRHGMTALTWAIREGHESIINSLLMVGARVGENLNPLAIAAFHGRMSIMETLLDWLGGSQVFVSEALIVAAEYGNESIVNLILDRGADINAIGPLGSTALHAAAGTGRVAMVRLLLARGATIDILDSPQEFTALHDAAARGHEAIVGLLLERGARVNEVNRSGQTAFDLATAQGHLEVAARLRANGALSARQRALAQAAQQRALAQAAQQRAAARALVRAVFVPRS